MSVKQKNIIFIVVSVFIIVALLVGIIFLTRKPSNTEVNLENEDFYYKIVSGEVYISGYKSQNTIVKIPNEIDKISVVGIEKGAFSESNITEIYLEENIRIIGYEAFFNCTSLKKVVMGNKVEIIDDRAFYKCNNLLTINVSTSLKKIGKSAFFGCSSIDAFKLPVGFTEMGESAFQECSSLSSMFIPSTVSVISDYLFKDATRLNVVVFEGQITSIGVESFYNANYLNTITTRAEYDKADNEDYRNIVNKLPSGLKEIKNAGFQGSGIAKIELDIENLILGDGVFAKCTSLSTVKLPQKIGKMGVETFLGCTNLNSVNLPINMAKLPDKTFMGCNWLGVLFVPFDIVELGEGAFSGCTRMYDLKFENAKFVFEKSSILDSDKKILYAYVGGSSSGITEIDLGSEDYFPTIETIKSYAFMGTSITDVKTGVNLKSIETNALRDSYITRFYIRVKDCNLAKNAFTNTKSGTKVSLITTKGGTVEQYAKGNNGVDWSEIETDV